MEENFKPSSAASKSKNRVSFTRRIPANLQINFTTADLEETIHDER